MSWYDTATGYIGQIHVKLPADASYEERVKALRDGYPFQERRGWAYKAWLKARKAYLGKYSMKAVRPRGDKQINFDEMLSPLDRAKAKALKLTNGER